MKVLFISYWGASDPLTISTVLPHLKILKSFANIEKIIFCTIERIPFQNDGFTPKIKIEKVEHIPIHSLNYKFNLLNKIADFIVFPKLLLALVKKENIQLIIARGAPAGSLSYLVHAKTKIPYMVESFEPHADYMLESKVWSRFDPRFLYQKKWEYKQIKTAFGLLPVSMNFKDAILKLGVHESKTKVMPCCVDLKQFRYSSAKREAIRQSLHISSDSLVGIYVGKFGGLYYDLESYEIFRQAFNYFGEKFFLIILTPDPTESINNQIKISNLPGARIFVHFIKHENIPDYLSAADFAFALYKPSPSKKYLSPVKIGEYWANGLPVLCTKGIGDESKIIITEGGGAVFTLQENNNIKDSFQIIDSILLQPTHRQQIPALAIKYRSFEKVKEAYTYFLSSF